MELSATGRVILGFLAVEPRSGYDIKAATDYSTRFFWAASYGQIYPELRRLSERGLIEPAAEDEGGRRRTTWRITDAGRDELAAWLSAPGLMHELRDEGLLRLFFATTVGADEARAALEEKRALHVTARDELRAIEPMAATTERFGPLEVLRYGLELQEMAIRWCDENIERLKESD
jgi:DNA-binding PadR family transcriptional regulator